MNTKNTEQASMRVGSNDWLGSAGLSSILPDWLLELGLSPEILYEIAQRARNRTRGRLALLKKATQAIERVALREQRQARAKGRGRKQSSSAYFRGSKSSLPNVTAEPRVGKRVRLQNYRPYALALTTG